MIEVFIPPASSHMQKAEWDDISEELLVVWQDGSAYSVQNVPRAQYRRMTMELSPGAYFHRQFGRVAQQAPYDSLDQAASG